ncbi:MAG: hypothetical protein Q9177_003592 [Variospora cf. flavescens]
MADIYRSADKVVIWLGPEENGSDLALSAMATLASKVHVNWTHQTIDPASEDTEFSWLDLDRPLPFDHETHRSVVLLLDRPWFGRLWIWQEVSLAADRAEILCGTKSLTWDVFRTAVFVMLVRVKPAKIPRIIGTAKRAWGICDVANRNNHKLLEILGKTKYAQCLDPRDKIFGVLYLMPEYARLDIQPDYNKSVAEVFLDVILRSIFDGTDANLLSCCELSTPRTPIMPSWVPDFARPQRCEAIWQPRACWYSSPQARHNGDGILTMTGVCVTCVTGYCGILPAGSLAPDLAEQSLHPREIYNALRTVVSFLRANWQLSLKQDAEILCRTLCCNYFSDLCEPLNKYRLDFTEVMTRFPKLLDLTEEVSEDFLWECSRFLSRFYYTVVGRAFILTQKEGLIGMAPEACRENDCIVVLLGCQSPIVLRPTDDGSFIVVGECYIQGLMDGEALLGPLPSNWRRVLRFDEEAKGTWDAFIDRDRGIWQVEDPRFGPLTEGWCEEKHPKDHVYTLFRDKTTDVVDWHDPRMLPSSLRERGVELQDFNLV